MNEQQRELPAGLIQGDIEAGRVVFLSRPILRSGTLLPAGSRAIVLTDASASSSTVSVSIEGDSPEGRSRRLQRIELTRVGGIKDRHEPMEEEERGGPQGDSYSHSGSSSDPSVEAELAGRKAENVADAVLHTELQPDDPSGSEPDAVGSRDVLNVIATRIKDPALLFAVGVLSVISIGLAQLGAVDSAKSSSLLVVVCLLVLLSMSGVVAYVLTHPTQTANAMKASHRRDSPLLRFRTWLWVIIVLAALVTGAGIYMTNRAVTAERKHLVDDLSSPGIHAQGSLRKLLDEHDWTPKSAVELLAQQPIDRVADVFLASNQSYLRAAGESDAVDQELLSLCMELVAEVSKAQLPDSELVPLLGVFGATIDSLDPLGERLSDYRREVVQAVRDVVGGDPRPSMFSESVKFDDEEVYITYELPEVRQRLGVALRRDVPEFYMQRSEVRAADFRYMLDGVDRGASDDWPVANVTWYEAYAYCLWLGGRLPTEEMWVSAARGRGKYLLPGGLDGDGGEDRSVPRIPPAVEGLGNYAWYQSNSEKERHAVALLHPWRGLHDQFGNVWEWCADDYLATPATRRASISGGGVKVIRGGSFTNSAPWVSLSARNHRLPSERHPYLGFRVAWTQADKRREHGVVVASKVASEDFLPGGSESGGVDSSTAIRQDAAD